MTCTVILSNRKVKATFSSKENVLRLDKVKWRKFVPKNRDDLIKKNEKRMPQLAELLIENPLVAHLEIKNRPFDFGVSGDFGDQGACSFAHHLSGNTTLKSLNLSYTKITDQGAISLANMLKTNTSLEMLDLRGNYVGDAAIAAFAEALPLNTSLTQLFLDHYHPRIVTPPAMVGLFKALALNTSLTSIDVSHLPFNTREAMEALAVVLQSPTCSLEFLFMRSTDVDPEYFQVFADGLAGNRTLIRLVLDHSYIGDAGVFMLCKALEVSDARIRYLDIEDVGMTEVGAAAVAQLFFSNRTLIHVALDENSIGDAGVALIAQSLTVNPTLETLHLAENDIGPVGCIALAEALKGNLGLDRIGFTSNDVGADGLASLADMLAVNFTLTSIDHQTYLDDDSSDDDDSDDSDDDDDQDTLFLKSLVQKIDDRLAENAVFRGRINPHKTRARALFTAMAVPEHDPDLERGLEREERASRQLSRDAAAQLFFRLKYKI